MVATYLDKGLFWQQIGMFCDNMQPGKSEIKLPVHDKIKNVYERVHGGAIAAVIDSAIGVAVWSCLKPGQRANTLELNIYYLASTGDGVLTAKGEIIHQGRTTMVGRCEVRDEKFRLIAYGSAVFIILTETD